VPGLRNWGAEKMKATINLNDIETARKSSVWDFANEVLYNLCESNSAHTQNDIIVAKVWLIGRSYAAAIERGRKKGKLDSEEYYAKEVAPIIKDSEIDVWLGELSDQNLSPNPFAKVVEVHGKLTDLFKKISGKADRSLASKYLHFHKRNAFFIYDSRAAKAISHIKIDSVPDMICKK